ncbi:MAG: DUF21 domain-containing protein [Phycisphaerales bacterium]|jgi:putative hemolysin|nr:DUF21 domain-containing protein [Phycisphaerales bacterium]MBT7170783.1 DUF21 domain-containing protein [Phycisphaerales bacterium]
MTPLEMTFWIGFAALNVTLMGIYAGSELGLYVLNKVRLDLRASRGERAAQRLARRLQRPNHLLAVLLLGTNVHGYLATFCISTLFIRLDLADQAEWLTVAVMTPILFVFADALPKTIFRRFCETLLYRLHLLVVFADWVFTLTGLSILVRSFGEMMLKFAHRTPADAESEFRRSPLAIALDEGQATGALTMMQTQMAERAVGLGEVRLGAVMTPRVHVTAIEASATREAFLEQIRACDHSRMPMIAGGDVVGVVDVYDVLADSEDRPLSELADAPLQLQASMSVADAICMLQRARRSMAIVVDRDQYRGIVTVKDLVEEIVGDLQEW